GGGHSSRAPISRPSSAARPNFERPSRPASSSIHGPFAGNLSERRTQFDGARNFSRPGAGGAGTRHVWETPRGGNIYAGGGHRSFTGSGGGTFAGQGGRYAYTGPHGAVAIGGGQRGA